MALIEVNPSKVAEACVLILASAGYYIGTEIRNNTAYSIWPTAVDSEYMKRVSKIGDLATFGIKEMKNILLSEDEYQMIKSYI